MKPAQIVLIEDNEADVMLVELALKESGIPHSLTRYESGTEALTILCAPAAENHQPPDMILMDLNTPQTDGFEALCKLRNSPHLSGVPIAVLTSSRARSDRKRAEAQGARYIEKPSRLEEFLSSVGEAVREMLGAAAA